MICSNPPGFKTSVYTESADDDTTMNTLLDICRNVRMLEKIRQIDKISRMILCRFRMGRTKMIVMVLDVFMEQLNIMFLIGDWQSREI